MSRVQRIVLGAVLLVAGVAAMVVMMIIEPDADSAGNLAAYWVGPAVALLGVRLLLAARQRQ